VENVVPSQATAVAEFHDDSAGVVIQQTVSRYADDAAAEAALAAGRAGVACGSGTSQAPDGSTRTFQLTEQALPAGLGDAALAYAGRVEQQGQGFAVYIAAIRDGRDVSALQIVVLDGGTPPDAPAIVAGAAAKLAAA
jgi:hypothetical protein